MEYMICRTDELRHHGIKGMKWGIRRFQRKDGSLTPAGEKRRARLEAKLEKLGGKKKPAADDNVTVAKKKTANEMSDDELMKAINRARMEDTYRQLRPEPVKESFSKKFIDEAIKPAMINSGRKFIENAISKAAENVLKGKADPESVEALKKTFEKLDYKQKIDKIRNPDKYLSEEDKTKRADREHKAEDRAAQKEGYKDAAEKAAKEREAKEASRKAEADETARVANEARSKEYHDALYNQAKGETTRVRPNEERGLAVIDYFGTNSVTDLTTRTNVSNGRSVANDILDGPVTRPKNDNKLATYDEDGNFIGYWSDTSGDVNGII